MRAQEMVKGKNRKKGNWMGNPPSCFCVSRSSGSLFEISGINFCSLVYIILIKHLEMKVNFAISTWHKRALCSQWPYTFLLLITLFFGAHGLYISCKLVVKSNKFLGLTSRLLVSRVWSFVEAQWKLRRALWVLS